MALLSLDARRAAAGYVDIVPCLQIHSPHGAYTTLPAHSPDQAAPAGIGDEAGGSAQQMASEEHDDDDGDDARAAAAGRQGTPESVDAWGVGEALRWYMTRAHAPLLRQPLIQVA